MRWMSVFMAALGMWVVLAMMVGETAASKLPPELAQVGERRERWEKVYAAVAEGLPKTAVVSGPDAQAAAVEMVAGLYDASLDQFLPHQWRRGFDVFRREQNRVRPFTANSAMTSRPGSFARGIQSNSPSR